MDNADTWDWHWLYYAGLCVFNLTEDAFWRLTPRQLSILSEQHSRYTALQNGVDPDEGSEQSQEDGPIYIDQMVW